MSEHLSEQAAEIAALKAEVRNAIALRQHESRLRYVVEHALGAVAALVEQAERDGTHSGPPLTTTALRAVLAPVSGEQRCHECGGPPEVTPCRYSGTKCSVTTLAPVSGAVETVSNPYLDAIAVPVVATNKSDSEVLVEGSWFPAADLPRILGNHMRSLAEAEQSLKEMAPLRAKHEQEVRAAASGSGNQEVRDLLALAHAGELANHLLCVHDNALGRPMDPWSEVAAEVWLLVEEVRRLQRVVAARADAPTEEASS